MKELRWTDSAPNPSTALGRCPSKDAVMTFIHHMLSLFDPFLKAQTTNLKLPTTLGILKYQDFNKAE